ncbi:MAG TPA: hypothetical protein ENM97_04675 [Moorella mulderi]|nr:hypothetical protein [Moorella mulderi]
MSLLCPGHLHPGAPLSHTPFWGVLGLFGITAGVLAIVIHLATLRTFGLPYLAGLTPFHPGNWKDAFIRLPIWAMEERPAELSPFNRRRQVPGLAPRPGSKKRPGRK